MQASLDLTMQSFGLLFVALADTPLADMLKEEPVHVTKLEQHQIMLQIYSS